jgi:hypothetical protein
MYPLTEAKQRRIKPSACSAADRTESKEQRRDAERSYSKKILLDQAFQAEEEESIQRLWTGTQSNWVVLELLL